MCYFKNLTIILLNVCLHVSFYDFVFRTLMFLHFHNYCIAQLYIHIHVYQANHSFYRDHKILQSIGPSDFNFTLNLVCLFSPSGISGSGVDSIFSKLFANITPCPHHRFHDLTLGAMFSENMYAYYSLYEDVPLERHIDGTLSLFYSVFAVFGLICVFKNYSVK